MNALLPFFRTTRNSWDDCRQPTPAERMAPHNARRAAEMQRIENLRHGTPRGRFVNGRFVFYSLPVDITPVKDPE